MSILGYAAGMLSESYFKDRDIWPGMELYYQPKGENQMIEAGMMKAAQVPTRETRPTALWTALRRLTVSVDNLTSLVVEIREGVPPPCDKVSEDQPHPSVSSLLDISRDTIANQRDRIDKLIAEIREALY